MDDGERRRGSTYGAEQAEAGGGRIDRATMVRPLLHPLLQTCQFATISSHLSAREFALFVPCVRMSLTHPVFMSYLGLRIYRRAGILPTELVARSAIYHLLCAACKESTASSLLGRTAQRHPDFVSGAAQASSIRAHDWPIELLPSTSRGKLLHSILHHFKFPESDLGSWR